MTCPAYFIFLETVTDTGKLDAYRAMVPETLTAYGGHFLVRGGAFKVIEGAWPRERTVVIAFPSRENAESWYKSPPYQAILPLRLQAMISEAILIEGICQAGS